MEYIAFFFDMNFKPFKDVGDFTVGYLGPKQLIDSAAADSYFFSLKLICIFILIDGSSHNSPCT